MQVGGLDFMVQRRECRADRRKHCGIEASRLRMPIDNEYLHRLDPCPVVPDVRATTIGVWAFDAAMHGRVARLDESELRARRARADSPLRAPLPRRLTGPEGACTHLVRVCARRSSGFAGAALRE